MSTSKSDFIDFVCVNDCNSLGCPGHKMQAIWHNTSDTMSFEVDARPILFTDSNQFEAMRKAVDAYLKGEA